MAPIGRSPKICQEDIKKNPPISNKSNKLEMSEINKTSSLETLDRPDALCSGRHRDDLVGRRVLCLPRTFNIAAPSPVQLSSSLWSPHILKALKEHNHKDGGEPFWCPEHHHHQPNQRVFISLTEKIKHRSNGQIDENTDTESAAVGTSINKRARSRQQHSGSYSKNSPQSTGARQSFSVLKSGRQAQTSQSDSYTTQQQTNLDDLGYDPSIVTFKCDLCDKKKSNIDDIDGHSGRIALLPWRLGTVRAVSHRDLSDQAVSIMIEFDLLDWQNREWYPLRDISSNDHYMSDDDDQLGLIDDQIRDSSPNSKQKIQEQTSKEKNKQTEGFRKVVKREDNSHNASVSTNSSSALIPQKSQKHPKARGAFDVVLIESSICCCIRKNAPTGRDKLWPGLVSIMKRLIFFHLKRYDK